MAALVQIVIYLIVLGCVIGLLLYLVSISPVPEPFKGWLWFIVMAVAIIIVIYFLLSIAGPMPTLNLGHR